MLIAEVNGKRCAPTKGAKGLCPHCKGLVIAKCGEQKIAHWAHKSAKQCDSWWESETDWHRMWKNYFPLEWQERIRYDEKTGEKHIADVCTPKGFTLEFQHSAIKPEERRSREQFYQNMCWVVDGTRLKNDYKRFAKGIKDAILFHRIVLPNQNQQHVGNIWEISHADELFSENWLTSRVPVLFDFRGLDQIEIPDDLRQCIWALLPIHNQSVRYVVQIPMPIFIENAKTGGWEVFVDNQTKGILSVIQYNPQRHPAVSRPMYPSRPRIERLPTSQRGYYQRKGKF